MQKPLMPYCWIDSDEQETAVRLQAMLETVLGTC